MNWIEGLYDIKEKDPYSQYGESKYLEHIIDHISSCNQHNFIDIGAGDGQHLSNTRYFEYKGWKGKKLDKVTGDLVTVENVLRYIDLKPELELLSIDIDGNDYWVLDEILRWISPTVIIAEFNAHYTDSRTIRYNPSQEWAGDSYFGFTFKAGEALARKWDYKVVFQNNDLNMYFVRKHLVEVDIPEIAYNQLSVFPMSERKDWIYVN